MANSTYAYGIMKITSGAENGCKRIAKSIIEATAKFDHFPTFFSSKNAVSIDEIPVVEEQDGKYSVSFYFEGIGRWSYDENIRMLGSDLEYYIENGNEQGERILSSTEYWRLKKASYTITFDFYDEDPGQQMLYTMKCELEHKSNTPLSYMYPHVIETKSYEYSAVSMKKIMSYASEEEIWAHMGYIKYPERIKKIKNLNEKEYGNNAAETIANVIKEYNITSHKKMLYLVYAAECLREDPKAYDIENIEQTEKKILEKLEAEGRDYRSIWNAFEDMSPVEKYIFDLEQMRKYIQRLTEEKRKLEEEEGKV